jgi:hypothetical protein
MKDKNPSSIARVLVRIIGGIAIVAISFFGTLFTLDYLDPDSVRATHAKSVKAALEKYRSAKGAYPFPFPDNPLTDLKKVLVDGGYLVAIPDDPVFGAKDKDRYRYVSNSGKNYGLLFHLSTGKTPSGSTCLTGVGTAGYGFWGQQPECPF